MVNTSTVCIMLTIVVYLIGMLFVGVYFTKKNNSTSDFYLGGRTLGPLVTAMSAEASDMSGYLLCLWDFPDLRICRVLPT